MPVKTKPQPKVADRKIEKYTQSLRVTLTPDEVADRADRAAQKLADRDAREDEQKAAAKHAKGIIEALDAELRHLSTEVRTRSTYGQVDCERVFDYAACRLIEVRLDTGEEIMNRPMTHAETQRSLFVESPNGDGGDDGDESRNGQSL